MNNSLLKKPLFLSSCVIDNNPIKLRYKCNCIRFVGPFGHMPFFKTCFYNMFTVFPTCSLGCLLFCVALTVMLIYVMTSLDSLLASFGVNYVVEWTNLLVLVNNSGYIKSVICSSGLIRLSNISLQVLIILSANTGWPLEGMYVIWIYVKYFRKSLLFVLSTLAICH